MTDRVHVLHLTENAPVPNDPRVWQECRTLAEAGYAVTVIGPRRPGDGTPAVEVRDGIVIHRFLLAEAGPGLAGHAREYAAAVWQMARLIARVSRTRRVDVVHAGNPPDLLLPVAWAAARARARFVFDQHDLAPELFAARLGTRWHPGFALALLLERASYRLADVVISTNESYRRVALTRGAKSPRDVFVVRNGPDPRLWHPVEPDRGLLRGKRHLLVYVGMMDPHDGVDGALFALAELRRRREDWHAVFAGDGSAVPDLHRLVRVLGLDDAVEFPGWLSVPDVVRLLSSADVCLSPEPKTPYNDASTLLKVAEYMAVGRPVVCFDLKESRKTAADAALFAPAGDVDSFAGHISSLLDDPERRRRLGDAGRRRVLDELSWPHSQQQLLAAYRHLLSPDEDG
jgi:glycosyltransferase involved in cell wall biosynthesis